MPTRIGTGHCPDPHIGRSLHRFSRGRGIASTLTWARGCADSHLGRTLHRLSPRQCIALTLAHCPDSHLDRELDRLSHHCTDSHDIAPTPTALHPLSHRGTDPHDIAPTLTALHLSYLGNILYSRESVFFFSSISSTVLCLTITSRFVAYFSSLCTILSKMFTCLKKRLFALSITIVSFARSFSHPCF